MDIKFLYVSLYESVNLLLLSLINKIIISSYKKIYTSNKKETEMSTSKVNFRERTFIIKFQSDLKHPITFYIRPLSMASRLLEERRTFQNPNAKLVSCSTCLLITLRITSLRAVVVCLLLLFETFCLDHL